MAMNESAKKDFRETYLQMMVKSWTDEAYDALIDSDPRRALAEVGMELPADAKVEIVRHSATEENPYADKSNEAALDAQVALFERGQQTGTFQLHLPAAPQAEEGELNADEMSAVAAGGPPPCCCCCC